MRVGDRIEKRFARYDDQGRPYQEIWMRGWLVSKKGPRGCYRVSIDGRQGDEYARPDHLRVVGVLDQIAEIE